MPLPYSRKPPLQMQRGLLLRFENYSSLAKCLMVRTIWLV